MLYCLTINAKQLQFQCHQILGKFIKLAYLKSYFSKKMADI